MAIGTPVDRGSNTGTTATTLVVTVGAGGIPAGSTIIVSGGHQLPFSGTFALNDFSITDDAANTDEEAFFGNASNARLGWQYYAKNASALTAGQEVTISWDFGTRPTSGSAARIGYITGLDATAPLDQASVLTGNSTTPSSGDITTLQNDEILIGTLWKTDSGSAPTQDADYDSNLAAIVHPSVSFRLLFGDRIVSSTLTDAYAPSMSTNNWVCGVASYKAAAGGRRRNPLTGPFSGPFSGPFG